MKAELLDVAPNGSLAVCHKSGWIQNASFVHWCHHILSNVKPTKDGPVILVLDGDYSHTRNVQLLELARVNGAHIVCLPPHCTHKTQLLGVAFMLPFKTYYAQAIEQWLKQNAGRIVTHCQVGMLLGEAFNKAASVAVATNGFRKTGPCPCNRHIFSDFEFQEISPNTHVSSDHSSEALPNRLDDANTSQPRPGSSSINELKTPQNYPTHRGRKSGSAALLKTSQYKNELADDFNRKLLTDKETYERKSVQKKQTDKYLLRGRDRKNKVRYLQIQNTKSWMSQYTSPLMMKIAKMMQNVHIATRSFLLTKGEKKWIVCTKCGIWYHEVCSGDDDYKSFIVLLFG
ncbi:hypothetical protein ANN_27376, partial [Periplaneta americana]